MEMHVPQASFAHMVCHPAMSVQCVVCAAHVPARRSTYVFVPQLPTPFLAVCPACRRGMP